MPFDATITYDATDGYPFKSDLQSRNRKMLPSTVHGHAQGIQYFFNLLEIPDANNTTMLDILKALYESGGAFAAIFNLPVLDPDYAHTLKIMGGLGKLIAYLRTP